MAISKTQFWSGILPILEKNLPTKSDPDYYASGKAQPGEWGNVINKLFERTAPGSAERQQAVALLDQAGFWLPTDNQDYWVNVNMATAGDDVQNLEAAAEQRLPALSGTGGPAPTPTGNSSGTVGGAGGLPPLRILTSPNLTWKKDTSTGKYYAQYLLPSTTNQYVLFEADATQMKQLFGNTLPPVTNIAFNTLVKQPNYHMGGSIGEIEGSGSFEKEVQHTIALALDQESLPAWVQNDPAAMSLLYIKTTEKRSDDWFYEQIQNLNSFKTRYPGINKLTGMGLTLPDAMTAFGEFETSLKRLHAAAGYHPDAITPGIVGNLLGKGYDLSYVQNSYATWKRMNDNAPALQAFNEVLAANGKTPLTGNDMYKFLQGEAPQEIYDIYEASAIRSAASSTGFGDIFSANDSLSLALSTSENMSASQSYEQFANVAQQALRLRHELDVTKFGLDVDDLIDVSFGRAPRSGKSVAEIGEGLARASKTAEAQFGQRVTPYTGFSEDGTPKAQSLARSRVKY